MTASDTSGALPMTTQADPLREALEGIVNWASPAEPNPPGSGEPVAWQCRAKLATGELSEWCNLSLYLARREKEQHPDWEFRPLYAAPLPSGLLKAAEVLLKYRVEGITRGYLIDTDGSRLALARLADEVKLLRTRATATGAPND